jgi:hypothetical protein
VRATFVPAFIALEGLSERQSLIEPGEYRVFVSPARTVPLRRPSFLAAPPSSREVLSKYFDTPSVRNPDLWSYSLENAFTLGRDVIIWNNSFFDVHLRLAEPTLQELTLGAVARHIEDTTFEFDHAARVAITVEEPCVFLGVPGQNLYHHILLDSLAKVVLLHPDVLSELWFAIPDVVPERMVHLAAYFGIDLTRIIRVPVKALVRYKRLILLPPFASGHALVPDFLDRVRESVLPRINLWPDPPRKVLITRRDQPRGRRQLLNEDAVIKRLKRQGYYAVAAGDLAFNGQVSVFHCADRVVLIHGSAGASVVFCRDTAVVAHLQSEDSRFQAQALLSAARDQEFGFIFGDCFSSSSRAQHVEWVLDLEEMCDTLDQHGFLGSDET